MGCQCDHAGACPWHQAITDEASYKACLEGTPPKPIKPAPCVYLGKWLDVKRRKIDQPLYECQIHGECTLKANRGRRAACSDCGDAVRLSDPSLSTKFLDPLRVTDKQGKQTHVLRNLLCDGAAFLVCGGPSLKTVDYSKLSQRGVFSLGVNNVCGFAPVTAFVCSDPPSKFHSGIFLDPKIMKFLPTPKLRGNRAKLRSKKKDGSFEWIDQQTGNAPNCWGFERRSWMAVDSTWFTESSAAWGNHDNGVKKTGEPKTVNTMFLALRLLQYLGARKIFLLGVDFYMDPSLDKVSNYAFGEERDPNAVGSNNNQYRVASIWFERLRPVFEKFGYSVFNCNPYSHLRAFPHVPYETALKVVRGKVPPEPFDLQGWYKK